MYIVTGGAGFIGSGIIRGLNQRGISDVLVVDNLTRSDKFINLRDCQFADYMDKNEFRRALESNSFIGNVQAILHQGACSDTMEYNGQYMMDNNFTYSKMLLHFALACRVPFVYASSAAVYGNSDVFSEHHQHEKPINIYGYSKLLFDRYVRCLLPSVESTVTGLRYFNVYGQNERHKGRMASVVYQFYCQLKQSGNINLFGGTDGFGDGEQRRDFIHVDDIVRVNLFFLEGPPKKGIFNVGTGASRSFNDVVNILIGLHGGGERTYIPFPDELDGKYQNFTQADVSKLRVAGFATQFLSLEEGIKEYYEALERSAL